MNKKLTIVLAILLVLFIVPEPAYPQCGQKKLVKHLQSSESIFIRSFSPKLPYIQASGATWNCVLNKGSVYRFDLYTPQKAKGKMVMRFFRGDNEFSKPIAVTSLNDSTDIDHFYYHCQKSGHYWLSIRYKKGWNGKETCAVGILSFTTSLKEDAHFVTIIDTMVANTNLDEKMLYTEKIHLEKGKSYKLFTTNHKKIGMHLFLKGEEGKFVEVFAAKPKSINHFKCKATDAYYVGLQYRKNEEKKPAHLFAWMVEVEE